MSDAGSELAPDAGFALPLEIPPRLGSAAQRSRLGVEPAGANVVQVGKALVSHDGTRLSCDCPLGAAPVFSACDISRGNTSKKMLAT